MAFRILDEDEKLLLNERQLEVYEQELQRYKERLAFVEKVEKIERADIKKFVPNLRPIGAIKQPELSPFANEGIGRVELKKTPIEGFDAERYGIADFSPSDISGLVKKCSPIKERISLSRELGGALSDKIGVLSGFGGRKYSVTKAKMPVAPDRSFDGSAADVSVSLVKQPIAQFDPKAFEMPERKPLALTKAKIVPFEHDFRKPVLSAVKLSVPSKPSALSANFKEPALAAVKLNVPPKARTMSASFKEPALAAVKLNVPVKADTPKFGFRPTALGKPSVSVPEVKGYGGKGFSMPVIAAPSVKAVTASAPELRSFERPEIKVSRRPDITMPAIKHTGFRSPERAEVKLDKKAVPVMSSREFTMPGIKAPKLSKRSSAKTVTRKFDAPEMPAVKVSRYTAEVPKCSIGKMPAVKTELRKPDIRVPDMKKLNKDMSGLIGKSSAGKTQEEICSITERLRAFDTDSARESILSVFKNEIKGTVI